LLFWSIRSSHRRFWPHWVHHEFLFYNQYHDV
jgi:hypothetical protein